MTLDYKYHLIITCRFHCIFFLICCLPLTSCDAGHVESPRHESDRASAQLDNTLGNEAEFFYLLDTSLRPIALTYSRTSILGGLIQYYVNLDNYIRNYLAIKIYHLIMREDLPNYWYSMEQDNAEAFFKEYIVSIYNAYFSYNSQGLKEVDNELLFDPPNYDVKKFIQFKKIIETPLSFNEKTYSLIVKDWIYSVEEKDTIDPVVTKFLEIHIRSQWDYLANPLLPPSVVEQAQRDVEKYNDYSGYIETLSFANNLSDGLTSYDSSSIQNMLYFNNKRLNTAKGELDHFKYNPIRQDGDHTNEELMEALKRAADIMCVYHRYFSEYIKLSLHEYEIRSIIKYTQIPPVLSEDGKLQISKHLTEIGTIQQNIINIRGEALQLIR